MGTAVRKCLATTWCIIIVYGVRGECLYEEESLEMLPKEGTLWVASQCVPGQLKILKHFNNESNFSL